MSETDLSRLRIDKSDIKYKGTRRKKLIIVIAFLALIVAVLLYFTGVISNHHTVDALVVSKYYPSQSLTLLNASGYVTASRKASVAPKVTGMIIELNVEEGSRVKKGDLIAVLENQDLRAAKAQAQANLNAALHNIELARAEVEDAKANLRRKQGLFAEGFITAADYDFSEARYKKAEAALRAAEAAAEAMRAAVRASETSLEYTYIRAPFNGVVLTKNADIGDIVTPFGAAAGLKASVVTMADMNSLQVEADVSESNHSKVAISQPCEILLDAFPDKRFYGSIHMIVPTADRTKASVMVKVRFNELYPFILPDMSAKVAFLSKALTEQENTPVTGLNKSAIVEQGGQRKVFLIQDSRAEERMIRTGRDLGEMWEILDGLKPGDRVVSKPSNKIRQGDILRINEK